jgi:restriction system protein
MPIPDYQSCMMPLLRFAADGAEHLFKDAVEAIASEFRLTEDERGEYLPSGQQPVIDNRVGWASTYLKKAGLLSAPRRGVFKITDRGRSVLAKPPPKIDLAFLGKFPEFTAFKLLRHKKDDVPESVSTEVEPAEAQTPHEALQNAFDRLRSELAVEILSKIKSSSPTLFEELVVDLLVKMGYGGSRKDAGQAVGRRGDEGIDGIIKEDRLGLDIIYIQAKRWDSTVGRPEIQKFAGALDGQRAKKGIFITTSDFSRDALDYVARIDKKIILMDGSELARLMIDFGVGVTSVVTYDVKKLDSDYFENT